MDIQWRRKKYKLLFIYRNVNRKMGQRAEKFLLIETLSFRNFDMAQSRTRRGELGNDTIDQTKPGPSLATCFVDRLSPSMARRIFAR